MASNELTENQQKELDAALLAGEPIPSFGGVVTQDPKTGRWHKANQAERESFEAAVDPKWAGGDPKEDAEVAAREAAKEASREASKKAATP